MKFKVNLYILNLIKFTIFYIVKLFNIEIFIIRFKINEIYYNRRNVIMRDFI